MKTMKNPGNNKGDFSFIDTQEDLNKEISHVKQRISLHQQLLLKSLKSLPREGVNAVKRILKSPFK